MKRLIVSLILAAALCQARPLTAYAAETEVEGFVSYLPALVETKTEVWDGRQYLIKVYESEPDVEADIQRLTEEPFEHEGYFYTYDDIRIEEVMSEEAKWERAEVSFPVENEDLQAVFQQLAPSIPYEGDDGFAGQLDLDYTAVWTQVEGYANKSFTLTDSVSFSGLSSNDSSNIPKTRQKSGVNLTLQSVDWAVQQTANVGYDSVPSLYMATAHYSGSYSKQVPTGYLARAWYGGVVKKFNAEGVRYSVIYAGESLAPPASEPVPDQTAGTGPEASSGSEMQSSSESGRGGSVAKEKKSPLAPVLISSITVLALGGLAAAAYFYFNNVCVYVGDEDNFRCIARRMIKLNDPAVDLRRLEIVSGGLTVEVKKRAAAKLFKKQIRTLINDRYTHRCIVDAEGGDFVYRVSVPASAGRPGKEEESGE